MYSKNCKSARLRSGEGPLDGGFQNPDYYTYWCVMQQSLKYVFREGLGIKIQENIKQNILALIVKQVGHKHRKSSNRETDILSRRYFSSIMFCASPLLCLFTNIQISDRWQQQTPIFEHAASPAASWSSRSLLQWWQCPQTRQKRLQQPKGWGGGQQLLHTGTQSLHLTLLWPPCCTSLHVGPDPMPGHDTHTCPDHPL